MKCKICNTEVKGNIGLSRHCKFSHNIRLVDYKIKFNEFKKPKCKCGNICKYKDGLKFNSTCGNKKCIKKIQKIKRLKFMKENPEKTAWRLKCMSYPEKVFKEELLKRGLDKKFFIIRERSIFPFYIDYAFENEKVAVEIDGSQHKNKDVYERDKRKEKVLLKNGWKIYRVTAKQVLSNVNNVIDELLIFIGSSKTKHKCMLIEYESKIKKEFNKKKKEREKNGGLTNGEILRAIKQRKVKRPSLEVLLKYVEEIGYSATGRKYNVSDNTIRKWIKFYKNNK